MAYHNSIMKAGKQGRAAFLERGMATRKYKPGYMSAGAYHWALQRGSFSWGDIEAMRRYSTIEIGLRVIRAPIFSAKWEIEADTAEIGTYVDETATRIWHHDLLKILRMVEWGSAGGENIWDEDEEGIIQYDTLKEIHLFDIKPLELDGELAGVSIKAAGQAEHVPPPRSFWIGNEAEYGQFYGRSRLMGAFESWMERCGKHGAVDVRRLWYLKNVAIGGIMYHPMGEIEVAPGKFMSCEEYAREILEKAEAMAVYTFPGATDDKGNRLWGLEAAKINGDGQQLLEYPKDLDTETLKGMGIMPEVIEMAEGGGGWTGRGLPMMVFLNSEDQIVSNVVTTIDRQIIRHGVDVNFGTRAKYKFTPLSLIEKEPQQDPNAPQGQPGQPQQPLQDQSQPNMGQNPGAMPKSRQPMQMSMAGEIERFIRTYAGRRDGCLIKVPDMREAQPIQLSSADDGWVTIPE